MVSSFAHPDEARRTEEARADEMVALVARRGVTDARVLAALRKVPRASFVPSRLAARAFEDTALSIEEGQTISQPTIVGLMAQAAGLRGSDKVLEVGTGSGYGAAVLASLAREVHGIERHPALAAAATARLAALGFGNVVVHVGDGSMGLPEAAPFDAIVVTASAPGPPPSLLAQLAPGGRLVIPVGRNRQEQRLICMREDGSGRFAEQDLGPVRFVPLIGVEAWPEEPDHPRGER